MGGANYVSFDKVADTKDVSDIEVTSNLVRTLQCFLFEIWWLNQSVKKFVYFRMTVCTIDMFTLIKYAIPFIQNNVIMFAHFTFFVTSF